MAPGHRAAPPAEPRGSVLPAGSAAAGGSSHRPEPSQRQAEAPPAQRGQEEWAPRGLGTTWPAILIPRPFTLGAAPARIPSCSGQSPAENRSAVQPGSAPPAPGRAAWLASPFPPLRRFFLNRTSFSLFLVLFPSFSSPYFLPADPLQPSQRGLER